MRDILKVENLDTAHKIVTLDVFWDLTESRELAFSVITRELLNDDQSVGRMFPLRHSDKSTQLNRIFLIIRLP